MMNEVLSWIIPENLGFFEFAFLAGLSFFTSMLTAAIGIGGGTLLLAGIAQVLPVKAIIPVHGVAQLGSNFGRAAVMFRSIKQSLFVWFFFGSFFGAILGGQIVVSLPVDTLRLVLGFFILYSAWGPSLTGLGGNERSLALGGFISTILTMFVGATGPFVVAILRAFGLSPAGLVATTAACLVVQHGLKVLTFSFLGFVFADYIFLMVFMVTFGFIGTLLGRKLLLKTNQETFRRVINIVLTIMAARLIWAGLQGYLS